ncbi:helix-turn-helix domain-containing protein [Rhizobium puerariae]|uniref:Helix-turn-helix domain-containing protein n=1 Tax=Rhizobium puerariae TaxID=1585791 RepID=A0ABV6AFS1_9HYPH
MRASSSISPSIWGRICPQSPLSIAEIGFATGFSSAGHFSRAFKVRFSATPNSLRGKISSE